MSLVGRTRARTRWPRFRASSVAWLPTSPVAPVMKMVFDVVVSMTFRTVQENGQTHGPTDDARVIDPSTKPR